jgi:ABC-type transport system involved in multi-copper enzyme maturation permease subunit
MWAIIKSTFLEAMHRRFALAMMVSAVFFLLIVIGITRFQTAPDGTVLVYDHGSQKYAAPENTIQSWQQILIGFSANIWTMFGIFAMAPLLASPLEKGNTELVFPKGLTRRRVMLAKFTGSVIVYALTVLFMNGLVLAYFRFYVPVAWSQHMFEVGLIMMGFIAVMSVMALVASVVPGQGQMIVAGYGVWILSNVLKSRAEYYPSLPFMWMRTVFNWVYRIFPKNAELNELATRHFHFTYHQTGSGPITDWMPLWSTIFFSIAAVSISVLHVQRKSF